jgi:hypothetical protein
MVVAAAEAVEEVVVKTKAAVRALVAIMELVVAVIMEVEVVVAVIMEVEVVVAATIVEPLRQGEATTAMVVVIPVILLLPRLHQLNRHVQMVQHQIVMVIVPHQQIIVEEQLHRLQQRLNRQPVLMDQHPILLAIVPPHLRQLKQNKIQLLLLL